LGEQRMNTPETSLTLSAARSTGLIDFETAVVVSPMIYPAQPRLVVTGAKPYPSMTVELVPLMYIRQPEYWGIEVIGSASGLVPAHVPIPVPYSVELDLTGIGGTVGIEVIGASHTEQIALAPEETTQFVGAVEGGRFRPMYPASVRTLSLRLTTASIKDDASAEDREIDLSRYEGSILRVLGRHEGGWFYSATVVEEVRESILSIVARQVLAGRAS
jgi:hypothetical protein